MTTIEKLEKAITGYQAKIKAYETVLDHLYTDAEMALDDDWDRTDDGFICQQDLIFAAYPEVKILKEN